MQKTIVHAPQIKLVGITARTNNAQLFEGDPSHNIIAITIQKYFQNALHENIAARKNPGTTLCAYTQYESDVTGDYTYFIGEEVAAFEEVGEGFKTLIIPAQTYAKCTNQPGPMPTVCVNMWQQIWQMQASELGGERAYITDFEVYDARSADHQNAVLDIYVGIHAA